jgi:hypothetical protein
MKNQLLSLAVLLLFARCGQQHQEGSFSAHYKHQPLKVEKASTDGKSVLTPSTTYDFDKGVMDATFKVPTENDAMVIKMMPQL